MAGNKPADMHPWKVVKQEYRQLSICQYVKAWLASHQKGKKTGIKMVARIQKMTFSGAPTRMKSEKR